MKLTRKPLAQLLGLGLLSTFGLTALASTPFSTAIPPGPEVNQLEFTLGYQTKDGERPGRYLGQHEKGAYGRLNLELNLKDPGYHSYSQVLAKDLGGDSQYFYARNGQQGNFALGIEYNQRTLAEYTNLPASFVNNQLQLPAASQPQTTNWDITREREQLRIMAQKIINNEWRANLVLNREDKTGHKLQGFGDWGGYVGYQLPAPIHQRTDQIGTTLEYAGKQLQGRFGVHISQFKQLEDNFFTVENPSAVLGDSFNLSRAPENTYYQLNGTLAYQLDSQTKFSFEADYAEAKQDDTFIYEDATKSIYDEIVDALGTSLDAKTTTTRLAVRGTHRLDANTLIRANYRYDDRSTSKNGEGQSFATERNSTGRSSSNPGFVNIRAHDFTRHTADIDATTRVLSTSTLLAGVKIDYTERDKDLADRSETTDINIHGRLRSRINNDLTTGVKAVYVMRTGSTYEDTITSNNASLRKYHLADVDRINLVANANYALGESLALGLEVSYKNDDYKNSAIGLTEDERLAATITADYFPSERFSGYTFITYESGTRSQTGNNKLIDGTETSINLDTNLDTLTLGMGGNYKLTADGKWKLGADLLLVNNTNELKHTQNTAKLKADLLEAKLYADWQAQDNLNIKLAYLMHQYEETNLSGINTTSYKLMTNGDYDETVHLIMATAQFKF